MKIKSFYVELTPKKKFEALYINDIILMLNKELKETISALIKEFNKDNLSSKDKEIYYFLKGREKLLKDLIELLKMDGLIKYEYRSEL